MLLKCNFKQMVFFALVLVKVSHANAQTNQEKDAERMISASRGAASPLFFNANAPEITLVSPGVFSNDKETEVRNGLGNFFLKLKENKPVTIGYIGGSITQANYGYRLQSAKYIQSLYPNAKLQFLNAGVSGTGTDLAACRIKQQILAHQPDLVFIEFAVNGAYQEGLEGIIRQIIKNNPKTDICLLYTIIRSQTVIYANNQIPENIKGLEKVASYYGLPSIHLAMEAAELEKEGKLIWKADVGSVKDQVLFSVDGIHPTMEGGSLYAAAIARGLIKLRDTNSKPLNHQLTGALFSDGWEDAKMLDPLDVANFSKGWEKIPTEKNIQFAQFNSWFPYLMHTKDTGASFNFKFIGTLFGFYDLGGPDVGQVTINVDGNPVKLLAVTTKGYQFYKVLPKGVVGDSLINRFNAFCNNRYRGQYEFIELEPGTHHVTVTLSALKANKSKVLGEKQQNDINAYPEKYDQTALYLGKILIKGEIVRL
jgi:lysophospholipase L1-like esterase